LSKATWRAARQLGLSGAALSKVIGLSEATVSRLGRGEWDVAPQSKEGQLAALLVRLFRSLDAIVGNDAAKVAAWMGSYNQALNGVPARADRITARARHDASVRRRDAGHFLTRASPSRLWKESWWSSVRPLAAALWRGVEAQHFVSTMKLVDSLAEQEELESILEASKPAAPATARQHYLLSTPFRYPSPHPSRFRPSRCLGVWYGAESVETACTELAYWRWRFLMDSEGLRNTELIAEFSLFRAKVNGSAVDLSIDPWDARRSDWTATTTRLAWHWLQKQGVARSNGFGIGRRATLPGHCGAVLDPGSLKAIELNKQQTWVCKSFGDRRADAP
jgi:hypothetical protein